jgi:hypothetical protein
LILSSAEEERRRGRVIEPQEIAGNAKEKIFSVIFVFFRGKRAESREEMNHERHGTHESIGGTPMVATGQVALPLGSLAAKAPCKSHALRQGAEVLCEIF